MTRDGLFIKGLSHDFDGDLVLDDINCSFPKGALVAVLGPSGCGKTTLLKCAAGLIRPTFGEVTLDGIPPSEARRRGHVGCAFQFPTLLPWRTALANVLLPLEIQNRAHNPKEAARAKDLLSLVELKDDIGKLPKELSGGMQQRVGLARALVTHPSYLFLDEPFGQLDGTTRNELNEQVRKIWQQSKNNSSDIITIMFVTHTVEEAVFLADQIIVLTPGPAQIHKIVEINLPTVRASSTRYTEAFFAYTNEIRGLTEEVQKRVKQI